MRSRIKSKIRRTATALTIAAALLASLAATGAPGFTTAGGAVDAAWPELAARYANTENGTRLTDGSILLYYPVHDLYGGGELHTRGLLSRFEEAAGNAAASVFNPLHVFYYLPFESEAHKKDFLERYEEGWYLLDRVEANPADGAEASVAYLVARDARTFEFIFINRGGDVFSVHIDSYNSAKAVTATVTEYTETESAETAAENSEAPEPEDEDEPEPEDEPETEPEPERGGTPANPPAPSVGPAPPDAQPPEEPAPAETPTPEVSEPEAEVEPEAVAEPEPEPEPSPPQSPEADTSGTPPGDGETTAIPLMARHADDRLIAVRLADTAPEDIDGDDKAGVGDDAEPQNSEIAETVYSELDPEDFTSLPGTFPQGNNGIDTVTVATIIITDQTGDNASAEFPDDLSSGQIWTDKSIVEGTYTNGSFSANEDANSGYFLVTLYATGQSYTVSNTSQYNIISLNNLTAVTVAASTTYPAGSIVRSAANNTGNYVVSHFTHTAQNSYGQSIPNTDNGHYWWELPTNGENVAIPDAYSSTATYSSNRSNNNNNFVTYDGAIWVLTSTNGPSARTISNTAPSTEANQPWARVLILTPVQSSNNPLKEDTTLNVVDNLGDAYEYVAVYGEGSVTPDANAGTVTWTVARDAITDENKISYIVKLKDGAGEGAHKTGEARALFTPDYDADSPASAAKHNPFYYVSGTETGTQSLNIRTTKSSVTYVSQSVNIVTKIEINLSGSGLSAFSGTDTDGWLTLFTSDAYYNTSVNVDNPHDTNNAQPYVFSGNLQTSTDNSASLQIMWSQTLAQNAGNSYARLILVKSGVTTNLDFTIQNLGAVGTVPNTLQANTSTVHTQFDKRETSANENITFVWGNEDSARQIIQQNSFSGTVTQQFPLRFAVYDGTFGQWMSGVSLAIKKSDEQQSGSIGSTSGDFGRLDMTKTLSPGTYTLTQTLGADNVGFNEPNQITFTLALPEDGRPSPRITSVTGAAFKDCTGLVLFIFNTRVPAALSVSATITDTTLYKTAHGDATFIFEVEKLGSGDAVIATWADTATAADAEGTISASSKKFDGEFKLEWGYKYKITELGNMRYEIAESGAASGSGAVIIDLTAAENFPEADAETGAIEYAVNFQNTRTSDGYLSASAVKTNAFTVTESGGGL
ncbi:MAG: hypothetical protein LBD49_00785 [Oscillospiraceae bacterium]|jgi:hypothetical protein|nr:hypothetical protein [Oscillospiraceae bacterium]